MKVSREQAAENREKILAAAARLFREKGFDGIAVSDLMKTAGLTHGGFYGHFSSKEELMAQACGSAVDQILRDGQTRRELRNTSPYVTFVEDYLSLAHRDHPGAGCLMAALGADASRQSPLVRNAFTQQAKRLLNACINLLPSKGPQAREQVRERAIVTLATLVGAQIMARAVDDPDLSAEVLQAAAKYLCDGHSANRE